MGYNINTEIAIEGFLVNKEFQFNNEEIALHMTEEGAEYIVEWASKNNIPANEFKSRKSRNAIIDMAISNSGMDVTYFFSEWTR